MKRTASLSLIALACATTFAITQVEAQGEPEASASAGQLDKFVGSGTCTGNVMAMGKNPGHATTGKYTGEKVLDGNWVVIHYDEDQSAVNPKPFHVIQYFGYDTAKKRDRLGARRQRGSELQHRHQPGLERRQHHLRRIHVRWPRFVPRHVHQQRFWHVQPHGNDARQPRQVDQDRRGKLQEFLTIRIPQPGRHAGLRPHPRECT